MIKMMNSVIDRCESTNDLARQLGESGAPHGSWISTRVQESGRGRLGRVWESQLGNLFVSLVARVEDRKLWSWIPLVTAVGVASALRTLNFNVFIKWPNDLWIDQNKLGGILCEAVGNSQGSFVVIGVGINCAHAPQGLDQETISLTQASSQPVSADDVRAQVIEGILVALDELVKNGIAALRESYSKLAVFRPGTEITWGDGLAGKVLGLGESGELKVLDKNGDSLQLFAEDVKVKFKGLPITGDESLP